MKTNQIDQQVLYAEVLAEQLNLLGIDDVEPADILDSMACARLKLIVDNNRLPSNAYFKSLGLI